MKFTISQKEEVAKVGGKHGLPLTELLAVIQVESGGHIFANVGGRREPLIRFEGHYFDKLVPASKRQAARNAGVSSPKAGAIKNPASQAARWQLLMKAAKIDPEAAYMSTSWGVGQVMGSHWKILGFTNIMELVNTARKGLGGQVELMARFIVKNGLKDELIEHDWSGFAQGYNGKNYKKNNYDTNLEKAYITQGGIGTLTSNRSGYVRLGSKGAGVRDVQAMLVLSGFPIKIDGDFGLTTKEAVIAFQRKNNLTPDGIVGPKTQAALSLVRDAAPEGAGQEKALQNKEVQQGLAASIAVPTCLQVAKTEVEKAVVSLTPYEAMSTVVDYLQVGIGILTIVGLVAGAGYAFYGWRKSKYSDTGTKTNPLLAQLGEELPFELPEPV